MCKFLLVLVTRYGLKPECEFNVFKFKERTKIDCRSDKEQNGNVR